MNRSVWTWIQLAISISNATFLVISHIPGPVSPADIASLLVGKPGLRVLATAAKRVDSLSRVRARV